MSRLTRAIYEEQERVLYGNEIKAQSFSFQIDHRTECPMRVRIRGTASGNKHTDGNLARIGTDKYSVYRRVDTLRCP